MLSKATPWLFTMDGSAGATNGSLVVLCPAPLTVTAGEGIGDVGLAATGPGVWRVSLLGRRREAAQRVILTVKRKDGE